MKGQRVLVVEDDPAILATVKLVLELDDLVVATAGDGREALDRIASDGLPDLILLDMRMPVMDGWQFAEALRARHGRGVPIVVMTAASDSEQRGADIAADGVLEKPFELEGLRSIVERFLPPAPEIPHRDDT